MEILQLVTAGIVMACRCLQLSVSPNTFLFSGKDFVCSGKRRVVLPGWRGDS